MTLSKFEIREKMKAERLALPLDVQQTMSADICARLMAHCLAVQPPGDRLVLAGYGTTRNEADVFPFMEEWCSPKYAIQWTPYFERTACMPVIVPNSRNLQFLRWQPDTAMRLNIFSILEPLPDTEELIPDIVLVPLLAFDRLGNRLGYGAGYYDETLRNLRKSKDIQAIGVAFGFQEVPLLPAESFDERLDMVVTERDMIICMP